MGQQTLVGSLVVTVLFVLPWPPGARAERRTALVIGNAAYGEVGALRNPVNDATDMMTALRQLGFEVRLLRDADLRTVLDAIETFTRQLRQGGAGLFYFAGHGMQVQGENYLIPLRARINREQDIPYEAVPVGRILGGMEDAGNHLNLIILDACRDNPYARQWRAMQRGLAMLQAVQGSLIAYATAPGAVAIDGSGRNGVYTSHLLKHLSTQGLSVEHLFKKVRIGVVEATSGKQTPWESSSLVGEFFFASPTTPAGSPGPDPEVAMWTLAEKSTNPDDVTAFLTTYPHGRFAPAARLKLQQFHQVASQQRAEEDKRRPAQERQRREREAAEAQQRAEAQRREEERQRQEAVKRREEHAQQVPQGTAPAPPPQVVRLEPESQLHAGSAVAVPAATLRGQGPSGGMMGAVQDWSRAVQAFRLDVRPVNNREFLAFVKAQPQWEKSRLSSTVHDGDYLKHWPLNETVHPEDMDRPVRYVSYFAAEAYCKALGKNVPGLHQYRAAANHAIGNMSIQYSTVYKAPDFNFLRFEWTATWWMSGLPDPGKRIQYQHGVIQNNDPKSRNFSPEEGKGHTGRSLGFRCVED